MADELKLQLNTNVTTSEGVKISDAKSFNVSMTGKGVSHHTQVIDSTEEPLAHGLDITTIVDQGFFIVKHLPAATGASNVATYVTLGSLGSCSNASYTNESSCTTNSGTWTSGTHIIKLNSGEMCMLRGGLVTLGVKTDANGASLEIVTTQS